MKKAKTVADYIKKYHINLARLRIYDMELQDEIWRPEWIKDYYKSVVVDVGEHNGDEVLAVERKA